MSFAAGIMLAAAVIGLVLPSLDYGGKYGIIITVVGLCETVALFALVFSMVALG